MRFFKAVMGGFISLSLLACGSKDKTQEISANSKECPVELIVLGVGQDAGAPQIGNPNDPAWRDPEKRLYATSLALIDRVHQKRYLFEATPDIREQMQMIDTIAPPNPDGPYIDGIFLTHAHIGHYAGLIFLGRESMGAKSVPVYVMPRMKEYLETNGPWSQLVELGNVDLRIMSDAAFSSEKDSSSKIAAAIPVKHRDEYSETAGILIFGKSHNAIFIPDIDSWEGLYSSSLPEIVDAAGYAFLDATFYDNNELPGRDMTLIPHPRVTETMDLIDAAGDDGLKEKIRFIHINHTNPLRDKSSDAYREMRKRGYKLANRGERFCL